MFLINNIQMSLSILQIQTGICEVFWEKELKFITSEWFARSKLHIQYVEYQF